MTATLGGHAPSRRAEQPLPEAVAPCGPGRARVTGELAAAIAVSALVSVVGQLAVGRLHIPFPSNAPTALLTTAGAPLLALLLALAVRGSRWWRGSGLVAPPPGPRSPCSPRWLWRCRCRAPATTSAGSPSTRSSAPS